jgi:hypothetical protein
MAEQSKETKTESVVKSVGLIVMTRIGPEKELFAVLSRRGSRNQEKGWAPESYPGACQVTAHGKLKPDEDSKEGLLREVQEELGDVFRRCVMRHSIDALVEGQKVTYCVLVDSDALNFIRLHPSSGGLEFVKEDQIDDILDLSHFFTKAEGVDSLEIIAMFPDEIEALKLAFEKFNKR